MKFREGLRTWTCPNCGVERTGVRRRCYVCTRTVLSDEARERISATLKGRPHSDERRQHIRDARNRNPVRWPIGDLTRGKPSPRAKPVGTTRVQNGHIQIKCPDGKWRYRARVMWEAAYGPIPPGRLIHHRNEDPFDDRLENFAMVTRAEHARLHVPVGSDRAKSMNAAGLKARYGR